MKFLFRWAFRFLILAIVLVVALVLLKDTLLKSWTEYEVRRATGLEVKITRMEAGLLTPTLKIEGFKLYNSAEFGGSPFIDAPELHLEWAPTKLATGKLQLTLVRFHLNEINIVESKDGRTNITELAARVQKSVAPGGNGGGGLVIAPSFAGINTLNLTLGKIRATSLRKPGRPAEFDLALKNEVIQNIKSWSELTDVILKILFRRGVTIFTFQPGPAPPDWLAVKSSP